MKTKTKVRLLVTAGVLIFLWQNVYAGTEIAHQAEESIKTAVVKIQNADTGEWKSIGKCRITTYCPYCNEPEGYGSASGVYLQNGHAACSWLPIGTVISIDGDIYTIVDICGTDAIDIFVDSKDGVCHCNTMEYKEVSVRKE